MITEQEASELSEQVIQAYVAECGCETPGDVKNALDKLFTLLAISMLMTQGREPVLKLIEEVKDIVEGVHLAEDIPQIITDPRAT